MRTALEAAIAAEGRARPGHQTLPSNTDLVGVGLHRTNLRFEQLNALRILPIQLNDFGSVSIYWRAENVNRVAAAMALHSLRLFADPHMNEWHTA